jgi:hypothetical protein
MHHEIIYGAKEQTLLDADNQLPLTVGIKRIQCIIGSLLYYA